MFVQIQFKKQNDFMWHYAYASETAWAEYIEKALRYSGYEIRNISKDQNPWKYHNGNDWLWVQRDAEGNAVALMDSEEANDAVYWAADFMGSSRFGERGQVNRPMVQKIEDY